VLMSPMAGAQYEPGARASDRGAELCRLLERCVKESGCVDMESLCVRAGERVWAVRVDVHVLDDDGALADVASVAVCAALTHSRRPDVTVRDDDVIIHSIDERPPLPLNMYHYPIMVTFGFTENGKCMVTDPTFKEEQVLEGTIVVGANKRHEICTLHCARTLLFDNDTIMRCARRAVTRAVHVAELIHTTLAQQQQLMAARSRHIGFACDVGTARSRVTIDTTAATQPVVATVSAPPGLIPPSTLTAMGTAAHVTMTITPSASNAKLYAVPAERIPAQQQNDNNEAMIVEDILREAAAQQQPHKVNAERRDSKKKRSAEPAVIVAEGDTNELPPRRVAVDTVTTIAAQYTETATTQELVTQLRKKKKSDKK